MEKYNSMRGPSCGRSGEQSGPQQHIASRLGKESVRVAGPGRVRLLLSAWLTSKICHAKDLTSQKLGKIIAIDLARQM